jgi:hypothetical protein
MYVSDDGFRAGARGEQGVRALGALSKKRRHSSAHLTHAALGGMLDRRLHIAGTNASEIARILCTLTCHALCDPGALIS